MPSEQRLHPLSMLFSFGAQLKSLAFPALALLITTRSRSVDWEVWALLLLIPNALVSLARYLSFRLRYEENGLVIRSGMLFRNERHIPYARIQNLDAVQNVLQRALGVVEVRVQTGGGREPEATMSVLPIAAFEEMRRLVFERTGRLDETLSVDSAEATPVRGRPLLHLPPRELMTYGLIQSRGMVVAAAAFGVAWEVGYLDTVTDRVFGDQESGRGMARELVRALAGQGGMPLTRIALAVMAFLGVLVVLRLLSMGWALVRLHGFTLTRDGEDLGTAFGLFTRVVATIPVRRIQTLTIQEGPLHQVFGRASIRVDTAGGDGDQATTTQREWLAPIIRRDQVPAFLADVLPDVRLETPEWRPVHPRAFRRAFRERAVVAIGLSLLCVMLLAWWTLALLAVSLAWAFVAARLYVASLGWSVAEGAVLFRSGWMWRRLSIARFTKIQALAVHETPFDRRSAMARLIVDTAGASDASHRVDIPYLPRETARELCDLLAARAARTAFSW